MTSTATLISYISSELEAADSPLYCPLFSFIDRYYKTMRLLRTAGHDTSELELATTEIEESAKKLRAARYNAVERFKKQGLMYSIVETTERIDTEADSLT